MTNAEKEAIVLQLKMQAAELEAQATRLQSLAEYVSGLDAGERLVVFPADPISVDHARQIMQAEQAQQEVRLAVKTRDVPKHLVSSHGYDHVYAYGELAIKLMDEHDRIHASSLTIGHVHRSPE